MNHIMKLEIISHVHSELYCRNMKHTHLKHIYNIKLNVNDTIQIELQRIRAKKSTGKNSPLPKKKELK